MPQDVFNEEMYEKAMTERTGKTQQQRRKDVDEVIERNIARWNKHGTQAKETRQDQAHEGQGRS